jgi:hypothetical protein
LGRAFTQKVLTALTIGVEGHGQWYRGRGVTSSMSRVLAVTGIGPAYVLGIQRRCLDAVPPLVRGQHAGCSHQAS